PTEPYYEAMVEPYPDSAHEDDASLERRRTRSIRRFGEALTALSGGETPDPDLDPSRETSFLLADFLRIEPGWLQALLELPGEVRRLDRLDAIFQAALDREVPPPPE